MLRPQYLKQNNFYDRMELAVHDLLHHRSYMESMVGVGIKTRPNFLQLTVTLSSVNLDITRVLEDVQAELNALIKKEALGRATHYVSVTIQKAVRASVNPSMIPEEEREEYWDSVKFGDMIPSDKKFPNHFEIMFKIKRSI